MGGVGSGRRKSNGFNPQQYKIGGLGHARQGGVDSWNGRSNNWKAKRLKYGKRNTQITRTNRGSEKMGKAYINRYIKKSNSGKSKMQFRSSFK